jgi:hypothetical protein
VAAHKEADSTLDELDDPDWWDRWSESMKNAPDVVEADCPGPQLPAWRQAWSELCNRSELLARESGVPRQEPTPPEPPAPRDFAGALSSLFRPEYAEAAEAAVGTFFLQVLRRNPKLARAVGRAIRAAE